LTAILDVKRRYKGKRMLISFGIIVAIGIAAQFVLSKLAL
jgi:hypothetical protein